MIAVFNVETFEFSKIWIGSFFYPGFRKNQDSANTITDEWLTPRGLLVFDYILSDANGLDTMQGRHQRCDVLAFIGEHFDVLEGVLDPESSMGITVARKRIS